MWRRSDAVAVAASGHWLCPQPDWCRVGMDDVNDIRIQPAARRWLGALSVGIIVTYALFFVHFFGRSGPRDGDQFLVFHSLQYWNAAMFGLAKQWTPLMCSGLSMAGEPQVPFMSFSMALSYLFGPLWGVRLATLVYLLIGWLGAYLYGGLWLRIIEQRALAATLFIGNGFFFCRLGFGHFDFIPFLILPLLLWVLHRALEWLVHVPSVRKSARFGLLAMLMGASISLAIDGSPVAIIHLLFWVGLYAVALSITVRSPIPAMSFAAAVSIAIVLDAGYLWPMLKWQAAFPRRTPDTFTSAFSLLWFALLPLRGKVLPANGNGHELSVFVGPIVAYCMWRYRHALTSGLPGAMKWPLLVVSLVSVVLGMGSLKVLHVPAWLSPFDVLRPVPGFRSIGVTGRYWGFLALPLSLLGSAALWKHAAERPLDWRLHATLGAALLLQLGFQANTLSVPWRHSPHYRSFASADYFRHGPENIDYITIDESHLQGEYIAPTRGVSNCYDMDDFTRADVGSGNPLVKRVLQDGKSPPSTMAVQARFSAWSDIHLKISCSSEGAMSCLGLPQSRVQVELAQAYHPLWRANGCSTYAGVHESLIVDCPSDRVRRGSIVLTFRDTTSDLAAAVSTTAWKAWFLLTGLLVLLVRRRKSPLLRRFEPIVTV